MIGYDDLQRALDTFDDEAGITAGLGSDGIDVWLLREGIEPEALVRHAVQLAASGDVSGAFALHKAATLVVMGFQFGWVARRELEDEALRAPLTLAEASVNVEPREALDGPERPARAAAGTETTEGGERMETPTPEPTEPTPDGGDGTTDDGTTDAGDAETKEGDA